MSDIINKNLPYIRQLSPSGAPDLGARLYEVLQAMNQHLQNVTQQANGNGTGNPAAPPAVQGVNVTGQNGQFDIAIKDEGPIYRGVRYYAEHSTTPDFQNPHIIPMGDSRNHTVFLGNQQLYWRAYSAYASSSPGAPVYHGSNTSPQAVAGGGDIGPPNRQASQGSGTGTPGQGLTGPGFTPFRSVNGKPPTR